MQAHSPSSAPGAHLLITRKFRELILQSVSHADPAAVLRAAPTRRRYVCVDLSDAQLRNALESATQPYLNRRNNAIAPALVGSARKVFSAIADYERRTSNLDRFEHKEP